MTEFRAKVSALLPQAIAPFCRRQMRRIDQLTGYPASHKRPGAVAMLHVGRCGSTVLANLLGQNPRIFWDGKLHRKAHTLYGDALRNFDVPRWTKRQFTISGGRYYGFEFKVLADQYPAILGTTTPDFLRQCRDIGVTHYILLTRRNTLRHVVSHYASKYRGSWHASKADGLRRQQFPLSIDEITTGSAPDRPLLDYLQEVDDMHDEVRSLLQDQKLLEVEYEADIDAMGAEFAYRQVCDFLTVEPVDVHVKNVKVNPFPLEDILSNYDEVSRLLQGTKFEWMLTD